MEKLKKKSIAFIGAGNMAFAMISGLIQCGYPADLIIACNKNNSARRTMLENLGVKVGRSNAEAVKCAEVVILAVKPQIMAEVCAEFADQNLSSKWIISIAAGISSKRLAQLLPSAQNIIRAMPNTPCQIREGMSGLFAPNGVDPTACQFSEKLFNVIGKSHWVNDEKKLNQMIAITGSSPAYLFAFMEAMQQTAQEMGFTQTEAQLLIQTTIYGAAKMVIDNPNVSLATLRENVTSKGGTTAAALAIFSEKDLAGIVHSAMLAACHRAQEMEQLL